MGQIKNIKLHIVTDIKAVLSQEGRERTEKIQCGELNRLITGVGKSGV